MPWYVIYTKSRNEIKVAENLEKAGIIVYCPLIVQVKQWSDRKKKIAIPLFNSYIFVYLEESNRDSVFKVTGVVRYLFWLGKPAIVRDDEILALQESLKGIIESVEITGLQAGDFIAIPKGPFQGKEGIVKQVKKNKIQVILKELGVVITLTKEE
jgi:transcription antitermination factor NusG